MPQTRRLELSTSLCKFSQCPEKAPIRFLIVEALVGTLNNQKALIGACSGSGHCKTSRWLADSSRDDHHTPDTTQHVATRLPRMRSGEARYLYHKDTWSYCCFGQHIALKYVQIMALLVARMLPHVVGRICDKFEQIFCDSHNIFQAVSGDIVKGHASSLS